MCTKIIVLLIVSVCVSIPEINAAGNPAICSLPLESGMCRAGGKKWGYDFQAKKCVLFQWGGCDDGNENRFDTEAMCRRTCEDVLAERSATNDYDVIPGTCMCQCPSSEITPKISLRPGFDNGDLKDLPIRFPNYK